MSELTNWAGNIRYSAERVVRPGSISELQEIVGAAEKVRAVGTGHSFNPIADTTGTLVSVAELPRVLEIDHAAETVRISAGLRYGEITGALQVAGFALPNLGSLPHISVAGACATGTHGSGDTNGALASSVAAIEYVAADGSLVSLDRSHPDFLGSVIALGALGVTVGLTLDLVPAYEISQLVYDGLPAARLAADFDEIFASAYSVSAFTDFVDEDVMVWRKARAWSVVPAAEWMGARLADGPRHPIRGVPADHATQQGGVPGPWNERLPHFRLEFTPSHGDELQSEYFLPRSNAAAALEELRALGNQLTGVLQVAEVRTVAADELWLSPSQGRDTVAVHFTWIQDEAAVQPIVTAVEAALIPLGARPHWAKIFTTDAATLRTAYPLVPDFTTLAAHQDPTSKFRNPYLDTYLPR